MKERYQRGLDRRELEPLADYLERLWTDDLFEDATPSEVARFAGCQREHAYKARLRLYRRRRLDLCLQHAEALADQIGWPNRDPSTLITVALESYASKVTGRLPASTKGKGPSGHRDPGAGSDPGG